VIFARRCHLDTGPHGGDAGSRRRHAPARRRASAARSIRRGLRIATRCRMRARCQGERPAAGWMDGGHVVCLFAERFMARQVANRKYE